MRISNASFLNQSPVESYKNISHFMFKSQERNLLQNPPTHSSTYLKVSDIQSRMACSGQCVWVCVCAQALVIMHVCVCVCFYEQTLDLLEGCVNTACAERSVLLPVCVCVCTRACCIWLSVHTGRWVGVFLSDLSRSRLIRLLTCVSVTHTPSCTVTSKDKSEEYKYNFPSER